MRWIVSLESKSLIVKLCSAMLFDYMFMVTMIQNCTFEWTSHVLFTDSFRHRRSPGQLKPRQNVLVEVVDVRLKLDGKRRRVLVSLENWLLLPSGTEHLHQVLAAVVVGERTRRQSDAWGWKKVETKFRLINYSNSLSPVVMMRRDLVGQIGWPSNVTDWLIGSGTWGL